MSYRIVYGPKPKAARKKQAGSRRVQLLTAVFLIVFVLLVKSYWPAGNRKLQQIFLPGEPEVTQLALEEMIESLHSGADAGDAFTAFCQQIIDNER